MPSSEEVDFKLLFESASQLYLVLTPAFDIVAVSDAYLAATLTERSAIIGRNIFDVFPSNPAEIDGTGPVNLAASLQNVVLNGVSDTMAVQRYDIPVPGRTEFEERFWSPVNSPVFDSKGRVAYIIHRVEDVTEFIHLKQQRVLQSELTEELKERGQKMEGEIYLRAQEIQERTRQLESLNQDLQKSHAAALEASRIKSEFLANMSHEIRTPMNAILGMSEIILNSELDPKLRSYVTVIKEAGAALLGLVSDVLDFSKVESGKLLIEDIEYSPRAMLDSISALMRPEAKKKGLVYVEKIDQHLPAVLKGDPARLRQIIINLLSNAIKFSSGGEIRMSAVMRSEGSDKVTVRFAVSDQGIGMSGAEIEKLFQPFVQGDGTITRKYGGTGLGLSISKRLVDLMDGKMGVESIKEVGSQFWFEIEQARSSKQAIDVLSEVIPAVPLELESARFLAASTLPSAPRAPLPRRKELILIVDDHPINQQVAALLLSNLGFESQVAENGLVALERIERVSYALVFMDVQMPELNGFDATRLLRKSELGSGKHLPVIGMTAYALEGSRDACLAAGMDDYLSKPIDPQRLHDLLAKYLPHAQFADAPVEQPISNELPGEPIILSSLTKRYGAENVDVFLGLFVEDTPVRLKLIKDALDAGLDDALLDAAHCLKGSSASVFAPRLRRLCEALEDSVRSIGISEQATALLTELYVESKRIDDFFAALSHDDLNVNSAG